MESEVDYTQELDYLFNNLKSRLLYYLSEIINQHPLFINAQLNIDNKYLNQIIYFNKNRNVHFQITIEDYFEILDKQKLLEANIFKLLQLKSNLNKESFTFIMDSYNTELTMHWNNAKILNNIYEEACFVKSDLLKNCLIAQEQIFNNHFNEITQRFFTPPLPKENPSLKFINNIIKSENKPRLKDLILKENPEAIEKIIINKFKNYNYTNINRMFVALDELGILKLEYGNRKELIECFNNSIGENKFEYKKVFKSKIDKIGDRHYKIIKVKIIKELGV